MKLSNYILFCLITLFFINLSLSHAQNTSEWTVFFEQDLNAQSNLTWVETNGTITATRESQSFQSNERVEQPILSGKTNAHHLTFDAEQEQALSEKIVRITVSAKQPSENAATAFALAYSTNDSGNSGWRSFRPTQEWKNYSFTFKVPKLNKGNSDYLAIAGDFYGSSKTTLIRNLKIEAQGLDNAQGLDEAQAQQTYVVQTGDSLSEIAKKVYGDGNLWPEVYEANKDTIENPNILQLGTELIIPSR